MLGEFVHGSLDALRNLQRIGARNLEQRDDSGGLPVEAADGVIQLAPKSMRATSFSNTWAPVGVGARPRQSNRSQSAACPRAERQTVTRARGRGRTADLLGDVLFLLLDDDELRNCDAELGDAVGPSQTRIV